MFLAPPIAPFRNSQSILFKLANVSKCQQLEREASTNSRAAMSFLKRLRSEYIAFETSSMNEVQLQDFDENKAEFIVVVRPEGIYSGLEFRLCMNVDMSRYFIPRKLESGYEFAIDSTFHSQHAK